MVKPGIGLRVAIASGVVVLLALVGIGGWYATKRFERRQVEARDREERKEALDKKLTESSTRDATRELVDEDFQFRIDWPGPGYKVMGEDEARRVVPEAFGGVLGVGEQASCSLAVTAELVPGAPLETLGELYRDATTVQDKVVQRFERGELQGQPAFFVDISGVVQGMQTTWKQAIVTRDDWAIRAMVWTKPGREKACNGFLEQNFHLLPGRVRGRSHRAHIPDEERTHYRVKDRHFEAPLAGVEATLPPDVDLSVGDREGSVDPDGLFTLSKRSVQVMIRIEGAAGGDEKTYDDSIVRAVAAALGSVDEATPPLSVDAFGHALSLRKIQGPAFESWLGATLEHGVAIRVRFNFPKGLGAPALDSARELLALVRPMSKSDAARVAGELPAVDPLRTSRRRRSLRSGTFIDFDLGCRAQLPRGPWIPFLDTTSSGIATPGSLALRRPDEGLRALVVHRDASDDLASDQRGLVADLATLPVSAVRLDDAPSRVRDAAHVTADFTAVGKVPSRFDLYTFTHGGQRVHMTVWGPTRAVEAEREAIASWAGTLSFAEQGISEETLTPKRIENIRFGFALGLDGDGWATKHFEVPGLSDQNGFFVGYEVTRQRTSILMMALDLGASGDADLVADVLEQALAKVGSAGDAERRETIEVRGRSARHLVWSDGREAIVERLGTMTLVVAVDQGGLLGIKPRAVFDALEILP